GCDRALLVVAPTGAEDVPHVAFGDLGIGGRRRDHEHAVLLVDLGGRNGHAGIEVADDEFDAIADELVGDRDAFFRIGAVVADENLDFLSQNAAGGVDVLDRLLDSVLELRTEGGAAAGDRSGNAQLDLRRSVLCESEAKTKGEAEREPLSHSVHLWMKAGDAHLHYCGGLRVTRFNPQIEEMSLGFWRIRGRRIVAAPPAKWPR